tara:strand:+ start:370 stop:1050 length:681 start_codon:yes stop_codon:yes gene_type:complete
MLCSAVLLLLGEQRKAIGNDLTVPICQKYKGFSKYCWVPSYRGGSHKNFTQFWLDHGHEVVRLTPGSVPHDSLQAVVHLRCGDVMTFDPPHPAYPISSPRCLEPIIKWLHPFTRVSLLIAGHQNTKDPNKIALQNARCEHLTMGFLNLLKKHFDVDLRRIRDKWEDWWAIHRAQKVVALVPSSFVFSAKAHALSDLKIIGKFDTPPVWEKCEAPFIFDSKISSLFQ